MCLYEQARVCRYCILLYVCEGRYRLCVVSWLRIRLPLHISPLPVFIIVPVCSGVPLSPRPFIQRKRERAGDDEEEESAEGLFPQGEQQLREDTFGKKKRYFSPPLGHNEECKFLN